MRAGTDSMGVETVAAERHDEEAESQHMGLFALALGSIGVVYGDVGTSPIYAFREAAVAASSQSGVTRDVVISVLSLIIWALILIVTIKYVVMLLKADNNGEGGTLSLMALAHKALANQRGSRISAVVFFMGIAAASLFFGDAMITPAISVLSAIEGLNVVTPALSDFVLPITVAILVGLFAVQSRGTEKVARWFGPLTATWFLVLGVLGALHIMDDPGIFAALNPLPGVLFLFGNGHAGLLTLGAVFLAATGGEALYTDLGHFGPRPIRLAWLSFVFPCLLLNYLGQGAMVLSHPENVHNPFFLLAPPWVLVPLVVLATVATVIASQAVITGAFSMARQAIQLGLLPRFAIQYTSAKTSGQIYMPRINWILLIGVLALVAFFKSSGSLAAAYGIAVTGTMLIDSILLLIVTWVVWRWRPYLAFLVVLPFVIVDCAFLGANLLKVMHGGWVPLLMAGSLMVLILTWVKGSRILMEKTRRGEVPLATLIASLERKKDLPRVPGTAVFLTSDPDSAPTALLHNLKHNKVLHEKNIILSIRTEDTPRVPEEERADAEAVSEAFMRVKLTYGYMETPNVPKGLALARKKGCVFEIMATSFFLSRRHLIAAPDTGLPKWQDQIFIALARNATDASDYFQIPTGRVVEVGTQVSV
jgi:KUP system potassium uptake protein